MIGNRACYDWLVDRQPADTGYTSNGYVAGGIEVSMEHETTLATSEVGTFTVSLVGMPTSRALLTGVPGINEYDLFSKSLSLVTQELLQLKESPITEFPVKPLSSAFLNPYTLQILEGKHTVGRINNLLCDAMVHILHKPFFSSAQSFEFAFCGASAFGLQSLTEIGILSPYILDLLRIEESIIRTDSDIHDAPIDAEHITLNDFWIFLFDSDMEEKCSIFIRESGGLDLPIQIMPIVLWEGEGGLDPAFDGGDTDLSLIKPDANNASIIPDSTIEPEFREFFELDPPERLTRDISCTCCQRGRQLESLPHLIISSIVDNPLTSGSMLKSPSSTRISSEIEHLNRPYETILVIIKDREFEFNCPLHSHIFDRIDEKPFVTTGKLTALLPSLKQRVVEQENIL